jgi:hypothetical protein
MVLSVRAGELSEEVRILGRPPTGIKVYWLLAPGTEKYVVGVVCHRFSTWTWSSRRKAWDLESKVCHTAPGGVCMLIKLMRSLFRLIRGSPQ